jgi:cation:H+ antiporter
MIVPGLVLVILFLSFILIKSADQVVIALRHLSHSRTGAAFVLSALLLALATSFPELSVAVTSALDAAPNLSLGNVIGANIANISLVAGFATLIVGRVKVHGEFLRRDVAIALIAGILPLILILDGKLGRVDGLILLCIYGAYATSFFKRRFLEIAKEIQEGSFMHRMFTRIFHPHIDGNKTKEAARLFIGIVLLLVSANLIVKVAGQLAEAANVPIFLVGLILLSMGTTLPELVFSFRSLEDDEPTMFFGNLLGSIIANSTLVVGLAATIYPIQVAAVSEYYIAAGAFLLTFLTFWFFIRSKLRLERWEGGLLLLLYLAFVVAEFF